MTPMSEETDTARVIQADRDAAADYGIKARQFGELYRRAIEDGKWDKTEIVQAFARHRLAQAAPAGEVTNSAWPASARYTVVTPTIPEEWDDIKPLRVDWNKFDLAEAYDLVEGVRRAAAQDSESPISTSLCAALDAIEAADCEWDELTKSERDEA